MQEMCCHHCEFIAIWSNPISVDTNGVYMDIVCISLLWASCLFSLAEHALDVVAVLPVYQQQMYYPMASLETLLCIVAAGCFNPWERYT